MEVVLNYFRQPPRAEDVSNLSKVLISGEVGDVILGPSAAQQPSLSCHLALQGCLNVHVALSLMSSRDKGDHREAVREFRNAGSILQRGV